MHGRAKLLEYLVRLIISAPLINTGRERDNNLNIYRRVHWSDPIFSTEDTRLQAIAKLSKGISPRLHLLRH